MKTKNKILEILHIFIILLLIKITAHAGSWSGSTCGELLAVNIISLTLAAVIELCTTFCYFDLKFYAVC